VFLTLSRRRPTAVKNKCRNDCLKKRETTATGFFNRCRVTINLRSHNFSTSSIYNPSSQLQTCPFSLPMHHTLLTHKNRRVRSGFIFYITHVDCLYKEYNCSKVSFGLLKCFYACATSQIALSVHSVIFCKLWQFFLLVEKGFS